MFKIPTAWKPLAYAAAVSAIALVVLVVSHRIDNALIIFLAFLPIAFMLISDILGLYRTKIFELEDKIQEGEAKIAELEERLNRQEAKSASILLSQLP